MDGQEILKIRKIDFQEPVDGGVNDHQAQLQRQELPVGASSGFEEVEREGLGERKHHRESREHKSHKKHRKHHRHGRDESRSPDVGERDNSYESGRRRHKHKKDHKHKKHHKHHRHRRGSRSPKSRSRSQSPTAQLQQQLDLDQQKISPQKGSINSSIINHEASILKSKPAAVTGETEAAPIIDADAKDQNLQSAEGSAALLQEYEWDKATANRDFIFVTGQATRQRKHKNLWTDANEQDIARQIMTDKVENLDTSNPALLVNQNPELMQNLNPTVLNALQDASKIKKKIYIPQNTGVNYIGMLIGPKGLYQKRLEEETGCKILIRGKNSQKKDAAPQPDDEDEQHVLIIGESADCVRRAQTAVDRIITADDNTREKIRHEQLVVAQQLNNPAPILPAAALDDSMMTPYGAPSSSAYIIPVPNDAVGLIIGKKGETIRRLQNESGAKIQVAKSEIKNTNIRNVFIEGDHEKYILAKEAIEAVINEHPRQSEMCIFIGEMSPFGTPTRTMQIADRYVGLVIGRQSETIKNIATQTRTKIFIPQKPPGSGGVNEGDGIRTIEISGEEAGSQEAEDRIQELVETHKERQANKERQEFATPQQQPPQQPNYARQSSRNFGGSASAVEEGAGSGSASGRRNNNNDYARGGGSSQRDSGGRNGGGYGGHGGNSGNTRQSGSDLSMFGGNSHRNPYGMGYGGQQQQQQSPSTPSQSQTSQQRQNQMGSSYSGGRDQSHIGGGYGGSQGGSSNFVQQPDMYRSNKQQNLRNMQETYPESKHYGGSSGNQGHGHDYGGGHHSHGHGHGHSHGHHNHRSHGHSGSQGGGRNSGQTAAQKRDQAIIQESTRDQADYASAASLYLQQMQANEQSYSGNDANQSQHTDYNAYYANYYGHHPAHQHAYNAAGMDQYYAQQHAYYAQNSGAQPYPAAPANEGAADQQHQQNQHYGQYYGQQQQYYSGYYYGAAHQQQHGQGPYNSNQAAGAGSVAGSNPGGPARGPAEQTDKKNI